MDTLSLQKAHPLSLDKSELEWKKTIDLIPTGTQTFSKAPYQHVNGVSPKYIQRGKGSKVWDIDGNVYIDYMLGLGPAILGHADDKVNQAVCEAIQQGTSLSLPHPVETQLAEMLIKIIPCAEMVKFAKNGSDVTTGAVRVARAVTRRDKIACCGYHGCHDWYCGSTFRHLGVPQSVRDLTLKFDYNDIQSLEQLFEAHKNEISCVILEPVTFYKPKNDFLNQVKQLAHDNGTLLIFDEVITGFRMAMGGAQDYFNVVPDMACFGKAMANGFPISAVVGRTDLMKVFDDVFFSFTFGGEIASLYAAIATIRELQNRDSINHIHSVGARLQNGLVSIIDDLHMNDIVEIIGFPYWPEYVFKGETPEKSREIQSLFQQEIVRRGVLSRAAMFVSAAHTTDDIEQTLSIFTEAFKIVKEAVKANSILHHLDGDVIMPVIRPPKL